MSYTVLTVYWQARFGNRDLFFKSLHGGAVCAETSYHRAEQSLALVSGMEEIKESGSFNQFFIKMVLKHAKVISMY